jgi:3',5'-nucleoside bisphosphate phosphatase
MNEFRADLHCHSTCSDGTLSPEQIVRLAHQSQLNGLSITDHDTIHAYPEALPIAQELGIALISGVEFSTFFKNESVHILAYSFALNAPGIHALCLRHIQRRFERNLAILERLRANQMPLEMEDLSFENSAAAHTVGRPHIAMALVKKGYVATVQDAFNRLIGEGKLCYVAGENISLEETLAVIHEAKGLAVIAHPHLVQKVALLRDLLDLPFDGIEGYYGRFHATSHERWLKIGKRKNWLITGGSDFHGAIKPQINLGCSWVSQETFSILYQHFQANQV